MKGLPARNLVNTNREFPCDPQRTEPKKARKHSRVRSNRTPSTRLRSENLERRDLLAVVFADFNGDGYADMAAGSPGEDVSGMVDAGAVNVIYGSTTGLHAATADGQADQIWHQGIAGVRRALEAGDRFGSTLVAGDFDGDGYEDLAVGSPGEGVGPVVQAGAVNILYGSANGLTASGDQIFHQDTPFFDDVAEDYDHFAESLRAGDYNDDGFVDLSIGVPSEDVDGKHGAGQVHVLFGSVGGLTTDDQVLLHQDSVAGFASSVESYDHFGSVLASGDFNGDGKTDLAIGVPGEDAGSNNDTGVVDVIYGHASGFDTANASEWSQNSSSVPDSSEAWDAFGTSLTVGDFDGDGADDLAVGVTGEDVAIGGFSIQDAGAVNVMYGRPGMFGFDASKHQFWNLESAGVELSAATYDNFGTAVAAGDYNGDGRFDLAIGTPLKSVGENDAGVVSVLYGYVDGLQSDNDHSYSQDTSGVAESSDFQDYFGTHLAAGDIDSDGEWELGVAVPGENNDRGAVHVFYGRTQYGFRTDNDQVWSQDSAGIEGAPESGDSFGGPLAANMITDVP